MKPTPQSARDGYLLFEMFAVVGLPEGGVNTVAEDRVVSEHLVRHPEVDKVAFTGSAAAGRHIASICEPDLRRTILELWWQAGGHRRGATIPRSHRRPRHRAAFWNSGPVCSPKIRVLVSLRSRNQSVGRQVGTFDSVPVGDPMGTDTQISMMSSNRRELVEESIRIGREEGARVVTGGESPEGLVRGWYVEPTIFATWSRQ